MPAQPSSHGRDGLAQDRSPVKSLIKKAALKLGYRIEGIRYTPVQLLDPAYVRSIEFDDVICRRMFDVGPQLSFMQVGAFDGITRDPLRRYIHACRWSGVLIEPQAGAAHRLRELYARNDSVVILQAAIASEPGRRMLSVVDAETAPSWAEGLASFDRATILKHSDLIPGLDLMIRDETVNCISFADALAQLPSTGLDLLQIDTEGGDAEVLSLFPFDRLRPAIVHWEVKHMSKASREACLSRLSVFGYRFASSGNEDMMALIF